MMPACLILVVPESPSLLQPALRHAHENLHTEAAPLQMLHESVEASLKPDASLPDCAG